MEVTEEGVRKLIPCRAELNNPENDWDTSWKLANMRGLNPAEQEFLWKMLHNLLPTQARLFRLKMMNTPNDRCNLCSLEETADLPHTLVTCPFNSEVSVWLMQLLRLHVPLLQPSHVVLLHLGEVQESLHLPLVWLIANTLGLIWDHRKEKKKPTLHSVRSTLEARINILRKTRFNNAVTILESLPNLIQL